ncbi:MAG: cation-translocating P-type ATPase [Bacteroidetes bacterium]|nr:cation-translocating P-type ATPase [Bacteroidota bacterium]
MAHTVNMNGLTDEQVTESRRRHGSNALDAEGNRVFWQVLKEIMLEPMFLLLVAACVIYFAVGDYKEGVIMLVSVCIVAGISLIQEYRSKNAMEALKKISAAKTKATRDGKLVLVATEDIVVNDLLLLEEGAIIPADGTIILANDFSVNESILTGESFAIGKSVTHNNNVYRGALAVSGSATVLVTAVGLKTMLGKIGLSMQEINVTKTPLQQQIRAFVRYMVWIGAVAFLIVIGFNYYRSHDVVRSFLQGLTLAMSILPEEIPVAFSTFMALGAFRLLKNNVIVKQPQYVETLGSATTICCDKTGTLTQNKMSVAWFYDAVSRSVTDAAKKDSLPHELLEYAMWSSETQPFDPMEKAIHALYETTTVVDKRNNYEQVHEYPIGGNPPMMTHIFSNKTGETIIAAKGAPEAILKQSALSVAALKHIEEQVIHFAAEGYRVLGVGKGIPAEKKWPAVQQDFQFEFLGLVAFQDPPKEHIAETLQSFQQAGISVKMITGDYAETAMAIARQVNLAYDEVLTGQEVLHMDATTLQQKVQQVNVFARMFPEAKLKVINALRDNGAVVAMTGDGVNDGPALKAAHIGIAMGKRGSEVAKNAASLILTDDDLSHMTDAVALGRKIYDNLKKAIQYIVSIHIPIILVVTLPLLLAWKFTDIFSPVHVIFLELIMGPTCSIVYENEPMEPGTMLRMPRRDTVNFLSFRQLLLSVVQGLMITAGCLGAGYYFIKEGGTEDTVRSVIFITLLCSNIFLTLSNRSFRYPVWKTIGYRNYMIPVVIVITVLFMTALMYVPFVNQLFRVEVLTISQWFTCIAAAICGTLWIDVVKIFRKK